MDDRDKRLKLMRIAKGKRYEKDIDNEHMNNRMQEIQNDIRKDNNEY